MNPKTKEILHYLRRHGPSPISDVREAVGLDYAAVVSKLLTLNAAGVYIWQSDDNVIGILKDNPEVGK